MDFASGLASLEQTASSGGGGRGGGRRGGRRGGGGGGDYGRRSGNKRPYDNVNNDRNSYHQRNQYQRSRNDYYSGDRDGDRNRDRGGDRSLDAMKRFGYRFRQYNHYNHLRQRRGIQRQQEQVQHEQAEQKEESKQDREKEGQQEPEQEQEKADSETAVAASQKESDLASKPKKRRIYHIALLCICIDDLPYEEIWKEWANSINEDDDDIEMHVSFVCHAKFPNNVKSEWLRQRIILQPRRIMRGNTYSEPEFLTYKPEWGSVQITRAMVDLLVQAMKVGSTNNTNKDEEYDTRFDPNRFYINPNLPSTTAKTDDKKLFCPPPVDKFIFISETCLPVTTLKECKVQLFQQQRLQQKQEGEEEEVEEQQEEEEDISSWINARNFNSPNTPKNMYEKEQFLNINRWVPKSRRWKADQWIVISRVHAEAVLDIDYYFRKKQRIRDQLWSTTFSTINASDEMYFPTALSLLGILTEDNPTRDNNNNNNSSNNNGAVIQKRPVTYTDWSGGMRNPVCFTNGIKDFKVVAKLARKNGCLLARKFAPFESLPPQESQQQVQQKNTSQSPTGLIPVDEWKQEIARIQAEEEEEQNNKEEKQESQQSG